MKFDSHSKLVAYSFAVGYIYSNHQPVNLQLSTKSDATFSKFQRNVLSMLKLQDSNFAHNLFSSIYIYVCISLVHNIKMHVTQFFCSFKTTAFSILELQLQLLAVLLRCILRLNVCLACFLSLMLYDIHTFLFNLSSSFIVIFVDQYIYCPVFF